MKIVIERDSYTAQTTLGKMYIDGEYFCETLEDTVRPDGIKVNAHTALPANIEMDVVITMSGRFRREMPLLRTDGGYTVKKGNVAFKGARFHGGNNHTNTEGCPLVAKNRVNKDTIQGTMEGPLTTRIREALERGETVTCICINTNQDG